MLGDGQLNLGIVASSETLTLEIELTLEQDIRKGQMTDEKIAEYKSRSRWAKFRISGRMSKELCGSRTESVYLRLRSYEKLSLRKHTIQLTLFILEVLRCIRT
jgi:hypothetical protein